jgi:hypothetical protein
MREGFGQGHGDAPWREKQELDTCIGCGDWLGNTAPLKSQT